MEPAEAGPSPGQLFAEDTHNLVMDYCADGVEAFHSCVATALASREDPSAGPSVAAADGGVLASVGEGTQRLYDGLSSKVVASLTLFEQVCEASVFQAPMHITIPQVGPVGMPDDHFAGGGGCSSSGCGEESEAELAGRIARMRQELAQVDQRCAALRQEVQRVDRHIVSCGDTTDYLSVAGTAQSNKHTIMAIAAAAENLQNMMQKAALLRAGGQQSDKLRECQGGVSNAAATSMAAVNALAELVRV